MNYHYLISSPHIMVNLRYLPKNFLFSLVNRLSFINDSNQGWPRYGAFLKYGGTPKSIQHVRIISGRTNGLGVPYLGNLHIYDLEQKGKQSLFYCFATGVQTANFYYWVIPCSCLTQKMYMCQLMSTVWRTSAFTSFCKYATCIFDTIVEDSPT